MTRRVRAMRAVLAVCALAALAACRTPATEIVLHVDTDMDQGPGRVLTQVRVRVTSQGETSPHFDQTFPLGVDVGRADSGSLHQYRLLPNDLGVTPRGNDATRTILVEVSALGTAGELFVYRAIAPFEARHTTELFVFLADRCRDEANRNICTPDETCGRFGCETVRHDRLPDFTPDASADTGVPGDIGIDAPVDASLDVAMDAPVDASLDVAMDRTLDVPMDVAIDTPGDSPPCGMGLQLCNAACVQITDRHNCGACGHDCTSLPNTVVGTGTCDTAGCHVTCAPDYADCDGRADNGCETDLTTDAACGACTVACSGTQHCTLGATSHACASSCGARTPTLCGSSCVDTTSDADHCGNCTTVCPPPPSNGTAVCASSACTIACGAGYHACGAQCLANASTGSCGASCTPCAPPANAVSTCDGTRCGYGCLPGWGDCDGVTTNGCERALNTASNCGACGVACGASAPVCLPSGASFACATSCTPGPCAPAGLCQYGAIDCGSGSPVCVPTTLYAPGTPCRGGSGVCDSLGACNACTMGAACPTGNPCTFGATDCRTGMPVCTFAGNVNVGITCPGGVCNGAGNCVACASGSSCTTGNPCVQGAISCASGSPLCVTTGNATAGTPCGSGDASGFCDGAGACSTCTSGLSCTPSNPCMQGLTTCPGGCAPSVPVGAGWPCPGGVCDGLGACSLCTSGLSCMVNECTYGLTSCTTGVSTCFYSGYVPSGTSCTGGVCDGGGACIACMPGAPCGSVGECWYPGTTVCTVLPTCSQSPMPAGTTCSTGTCDGAGSCTGGTPDF